MNGAPPVAGKSLVSIVRHGRWAELRLERPAKRNALSRDLAEDFVAGLRILADDGIQAVVLSAAGPVFCAGGDRAEAQDGRRSPVDELLAALHAAPFFLIARVEGDVVGGGMALLSPCPVVLCLPSVTFLLPAARTQDIFPEAFLPTLGHAAGDRALLEFSLRSEPLPADQAKDLGLVNSVVAPDAMDATVAGWVDLVLERPTAAVGARRFWRERRSIQMERPSSGSAE